MTRSKFCQMAQILARIALFGTYVTNYSFVQEISLSEIPPPATRPIRIGQFVPASFFLLPPHSFVYPVALLCIHHNVNLPLLNSIPLAGFFHALGTCSTSTIPSGLVFVLYQHVSFHGSRHCQKFLLWIQYYWYVRLLLL